MKKKNLILFIVLALLMSLGLAGCKKKTDETAKVPVPEITDSHEVSEESDIPVLRETITGLVADGTSMHILQLETADGKLYLFATEGVEVVAGDEGLLIGEEVKVTYTGTLKEDTTNTATKIVMLAYLDVDETLDAKHLEGYIIDITGNTIIVDMTDGHEFTFIVNENRLAGENALKVSDAIRVYYTGEYTPDSSRHEIQIVDIEVIK